MTRVTAAWMAVIFAIIQALTACNSTGCTDNQSSLPLAGFYDLHGREITVDSIEIRGIGAPDDSVLYPMGKAIREAYLPLRSFEPDLRYQFRYASLPVSDTLRFVYDAFPYFASEECGAMYRYRIHRLDYTRNVIDSVSLVDSLITNSPVRQIHIFFRTNEQ